MGVSYACKKAAALRTRTPVWSGRSTCSCRGSQDGFRPATEGKALPPQSGGDRLKKCNGRTSWRGRGHESGPVARHFGCPVCLCSAQSRCSARSPKTTSRMRSDAAPPPRDARWAGNICMCCWRCGRIVWRSCRLRIGLIGVFNRLACSASLMSAKAAGGRRLGISGSHRSLGYGSVSNITQSPKRSFARQGLIKIRVLKRTRME